VFCILKEKLETKKQILPT